MKINNQIIIILILFFGGCSAPTEFIIDEIVTDSLKSEIDSLKTIIKTLEINIETSEIYPNYDVSPRAGAIKSSVVEWNGVIIGLIINTSKDTLKNVAMRFTLKDFEGNTLTTVIGYFTLEQTQFRYFVEYPYKKELNLVPGKKYFFWAATETMTFSVYNVGWWFTPLISLNKE